MTLNHISPRSLPAEGKPHGHVCRTVTPAHLGGNGEEIVHVAF